MTSAEAGEAAAAAAAATARTAAAATAVLCFAFAPLTLRCRLINYIIRSPIFFFPQPYSGKFLDISAEMANSLLQVWHGDVSSLPCHSFPFGGAYIPSRYVECRGGNRLYIAAVPDSIIGGHRWRRRVAKETLAIELLNENDLFGENPQTVLPARFCWITKKGRVKRAKLWMGTDTMRSVFLNAYTRQKQCPLAVHRVLGWSFRCPWHLMQNRLAWTDYDVDHRDGHHENNVLANLYLWNAAGESGHRAASGRLGAESTWQQQQTTEETDAEDS